MLKIILIQIALFLLPIALYGLWTALANQFGWKNTRLPLTVLLSLGAALTVIGLAWSTFSDPKAGSKYTPATMIDGKIVDGNFVEP